MERWSGKVAVVTGASSGIGAAIAEALVHRGMLVVGMARREDRIKRLAEKLSTAGEPGQLYSVKTDLGKEDEIVSAFDWVEKELGGVDVLVNNAAVYNRINIEDGTAEEWRSVLDVNVIGVAVCTREFLKNINFHNKDQGHIFMINSVRCHVVDSAPPMYCASKFALKGISKCLRSHLAEKNCNIKVTDICPGLTRTEIVDESVLNKFLPFLPMESQDVAQALVDALSASPVTQVCEIIMNPIPTKLGLGLY